jgi:GntR family phosphonate transport system transcriptional regulator
MTKPAKPPQAGTAPAPGATPLLAQRGTTLWRQIESALERAIAAGEFAEGRLPSAEALAARFGVNRHTVRQALQGLRERGLLHTARGRGSFVRQAAIEYALGERPRFSANLARHKLAGRFRVLAAETVAADAGIARALGLRAGAPLERVETLGLADGIPISAATHYFPTVRLAGIGALLAKTGSVTRALARLGVADYLRASSRITAQLPEAATAARLEMGESQPVLFVRAINVDLEGRPIQYSETAFCADRVQLTIER